MSGGELVPTADKGPQEQLAQNLQYLFFEL